MFDRRRSNIPSSLRARGRHALPWLRRSWTNRWKVLLAPALIVLGFAVFPATGATLNVCPSGCAYSSIQEAVTAASAGDTIAIAAGIYEESVTLSKQVTLDGVGDTTIINPLSGDGITVTGSGASAASRMVVKDLKVTDASYGIAITDGISYLTLDNVTITANASTGLWFSTYSSITDVVITNTRITSNLGAGIRIASAIPSFNGFVLQDSVVSNNSLAAIDYNPSGSAVTATGFVISGTTFANNVQAGTGNVHDLSFAGFTGNLSLSNVTVTLSNNSSSTHGHGVVFYGVPGGTPVASWPAAGTVTFNGVTISGSPGKSGLYFLRYSSMSNVSFSSVDVSGVIPGGVWPQVQIDHSSATALNLGTMTLKTLATDVNGGGVSATSATFKNSSTGTTLDRSVMADNFQIEDQVGHKTDESARGLVRWTANKIYAAPVAYVVYGGIQKAIDAASAGDTVYIRAGTYSESVTLNKGITLSGAKAGVAAGPSASPTGRNFATFAGESRITSKVTITGTNATLDGFVIDVTGDHSVYAYGASITVKNTALIGRSNVKTNSGGASGITTQSAGGTAESYVFEYNRLSGGRYALNYDGDSNTVGLVFRNNYVTDVERGLQTQGDTAGTIGISYNLFEDVTVGIRAARDGATISGNTFRDFAYVLDAGGNPLAEPSATTMAAIRISSGTYLVCYESAPRSSQGLTVTNNVMSGTGRGVLIEDPVASPVKSYRVTKNRFASLTPSAATATVYAKGPVVIGYSGSGSAYAVSGCGTEGNLVGPFSWAAGTTINASSNYWGADAGPTSPQTNIDFDGDGDTIEAFLTITDYLGSSTSQNLFSTGFWPSVEPSATVTESLTTTSDAPPVVAALALGEVSTSIVLDFGPITGDGQVEVTVSDTPTDGSVSFAGNTPITITFSGTFTPPVKVCLSYDDSSFPDGVTPALWHYEQTSPGTYEWVALETVSLDTVNKILCALTYSFSDFGVGIAATDACDVTSNVLTVTIPEDGDVTVSRSGSSLTVTFAPGTECAASPITIGPDESSGQIDTLALVGDAGDETVTFETATPTNWGANSTSSLARTIDLGAGTGDLVILEGTSSGDTITASAIASAFTGVESLRLDGLAGNDTLTAGTTPDSLYGGAGMDILKGGDGADSLYGGDDNDSLQGGAGTDCADYSTETDAVTVDLTTGTGSGGTAVDSDTYASVECVQGGSGNDTLSGSAYADTLYGNGGSDTLRGRGGADTLNGGTGTGDTVTYAEQTYAVTVNLTAGTASGTTAGSDTITLVENVTGGTVGDVIVGDSNANTLNGGSGNDTLVGMQGDDTFTGGTGTDTLTYDDVTYGAGAAASGLGLGAGFASGSPQNTIGAGTDTINSDIENLTGSSYADTLQGTSGVNTINGLGGTDTIYGGAGIDTLNGGADDDNIYGQAGADSIRGGSEADVLYGGADADTLFGDAGNDTLQGGSGGDTLRGGDGNDTLVGGAALVSGVTIAGVDIFYGDTGTDTVSYNNTYFNSTSADGAYLAASSAVTFKLNAVGIQQGTGGAGTDVAGDLIENLDGSSYNDVLVGNTLANLIRGLGGDDTIQGGDNNDTLEGGAGTNKVEGQAGTDTCSSTGGAYVYLWPKTCEIAG